LIDPLRQTVENFRQLIAIGAFGGLVE